MAVTQLANGEPIAAGYLARSLLRRGKVYEVYDAWSEDRFSGCIVKMVRPDRVNSANTTRLIREGTLVTTCSHPHLVRGYEVGTTPRPFIALEILTGVTLGNLIRHRRRPLGAADIAMLGSHLCSALRYLHGRGVLHLDVKPENVVIEAGRGKLLDLSLARSPGFVRAGMGTPSYLAPEQAVPGVVGEAADVWGLALTLFEAATGTNPFHLSGGDGVPGAGVPASDARCPTCDEIVDYLQLRMRSPALAKLRRFPRDLCTAVDAALDPWPDNRPSMGEFGETLDRHTGVEPMWPQ